MIEFDHVAKRYPDGTVAVADFSAALAPHTTTVLVGSSGCGKTTLLRMVNRMVDPSQGEVRIDGEPIAAKDPVRLRRSIGYVMQHAGLLPHRSVADNIATVPLLLGVRRSEARARALELMELVGLDTTMADRYPHQLSGGQQQRVGVARGLAADPNILLMDEPFGAVDPLVRRDLQNELLRLQAGLGKTIVFVTHDIDEAFLLGDRIIILRDGGEVAQDGTSTEILTRPADDFVAGIVGLDRGGRTYHVEPGGVLVDANGRAAGVLTDAPRPDDRHHDTVRAGGAMQVGDAGRAVRAGGAAPMGQPPRGSDAAQPSDAERGSRAAHGSDTAPEGDAERPSPGAPTTGVAHASEAAQRGDPAHGSDDAPTPPGAARPGTRAEPPS